MMEISIDEFMEKAAALKWNVDIQHTHNWVGTEYELQVPPVVIPLGKILISAFAPASSIDCNISSGCI